MGVKFTTKWLASRLTPHAYNRTVAEQLLRVGMPDPSKVAYLVDGGRFFHAASHKFSANDQHSTLSEFTHGTLSDVSSRCIMTKDSPVFLLIDDYNRENTMKAHTMQSRAHAVGHEFTVDATVRPNPLLANTDFRGLYGSRTTRLAMYNRVAELVQWGRTIFADRPHCVSVNPADKQLLVQRVNAVDIVLHAMAIDVAHALDIGSLLCGLASTNHIDIDSIPTVLHVMATLEPTGADLRISCEMGGDWKTILVQADVSEVQWLPFRWQVGDHFIVVNFHTVGSYTSDANSRMTFQFAPVIYIDLFESLPCPQLTTNPLESDFSAVEFAAALAADNFDCVVRCAEDSDWQLFAIPLQRAILDKGLCTAIISHVCPSQTKRAPDMWVDMRRVVDAPDLRGSLLWYIIGHHDFSTGIMSVGEVGQKNTVEAWVKSGRPLPVRTNPMTPSKFIVDEKACVRFARSALKKEKTLEESIVDGAKSRISLTTFLKAAVHPVRTMAAALWPLDAIVVP